MTDNDAATSFMHVERAVKLEANVSDFHAWYANAVAQQASRASKLKQPVLARRMKSALERAVALDERNLDERDVLVDFYSMAPDSLRAYSALAIWYARV